MEQVPLCPYWTGTLTRTLGTAIIYEQVPGPVSKSLRSKYSGDGHIRYHASETGVLVPLLHRYIYGDIRDSHNL